MNELYYSDGVRWLSLPHWARFFLHLGEELASHISTNRRLVATIAVPTRSYTAALVACGVVAQRSLLPAATIAVQEYFQLLIQAEKGTPVTVLKKGVRHKGVIDGYFLAHETTWLRVKIRGGDLGAWACVGKDDALNVELVSDQQDEAIPKRITAKAVMPLSAFAESLIGPERAASFGMVSRCDCVIVGHLTSLKSEILETRFAVRDQAGAFNHGVLQDVLRVRDFLDPGEHFRSVCMTLSKRSAPKASTLTPSVVVFDGCTAFLRSRGLFPSANWIAVLDNRDATFADAMTACNQDYVKRKADDIRFDSVLDLPGGIDLVTYYESR